MVHGMPARVADSTTKFCGGVKLSTVLSTARTPMEDTVKMRSKLSPTCR
jgi:hypothetical protein